jgi:hypothetical protein
MLWHRADWYWVSLRTDPLAPYCGVGVISI